MSLLETGIRVLDFDLSDDVIERVKAEWKIKAHEIGPYPSGFKGKGIVMCAGGVSYFTCVWVGIKRLRAIGCFLPIEVWYVGTELSKGAITELSKMGVHCKDFNDHTDLKLSGYSLKPLAILLSEFEEVLFLDADNLCVTPPDELFEDRGYLATGTLFWPDFWRTDRGNPIWRITECADYQISEQESGQVLINKAICWRELNLCLYFNIKSPVYYKLLYGDKDTFKFAWSALKSPYTMVQIPPALCGYNKQENFIGHTILQSFPNGRGYFLHRNLLKWDVTLPNECTWTHVRYFISNSGLPGYYFRFSDNGHFYLDISGDVETVRFVERFGEIENECQQVLLDLRKSEFYQNFLHHCHLREKRFKMNLPFEV